MATPEMDGLGEARVKELRARLRGQVLRPGDDGYDAARKVWNGMFDRHPALIARCTGAADVMTAITFAREHNLLVAVKGGGHSFPGHSVCDGGVMIDLSPMKSVRVEPEARTAVAEPGVVWGEFDRETHAFGLAVTGGQISHTGIAGLTLGGGIGWLARTFSLTSDNLLSADLVTAEGRLLKASASENADLFWGLRGGGGNFGIVTAFQYRLHPVSMVYGGLVAHPLPKAKDALRFFRDFAKGAPDQLTMTGAFLHTPDGHPAFGVAFCYCGPVQEGEKVVKPLRQYGPPVMEQVGPMPYPAVQSMMDQAAEPGRRYYVKGHMVNELSDGVIDALADHFARVPSPFSVLLVIQLGGAVTRRPKEETAYYHRDAAFALTILSAWLDPGEDEKQMQWARQLDRAVQPFVTGGVYVNELGDEGEERIKAAYGAKTYARLVALKNRYDPTNFFRLNQNIKPTTDGRKAS